MNTGHIEDSTLYYGTNTPRNHLRNSEGNGSGSYLEIITGIGWNSLIAFTPLSKTMWIVLGYTYGFHVIEGPDLGTIRICVSEMLKVKDSLYKIASGFMSLAHYNDMEQYGISHANRDFNLKLSNVCEIIFNNNMSENITKRCSQIARNLIFLKIP